MQAVRCDRRIWAGVMSWGSWRSESSLCPTVCVWYVYLPDVCFPISCELSYSPLKYWPLTLFSLAQDCSWVSTVCGSQIPMETPYTCNYTFFSFNMSYANLCVRPVKEPRGVEETFFLPCSVKPRIVQVWNLGCWHITASWEDQQALSLAPELLGWGITWWGAWDAALCSSQWGPSLVGRVPGTQAGLPKVPGAFCLLPIPLETGHFLVSGLHKIPQNKCPFEPVWVAAFSSKTSHP